MIDKRLKTTFDEVPALYDEVRPTYPAPLINDVIDLSGIPEKGSILEIGCGTGQATKPFLDRGYSVLAVELGPNLAEFTCQKFASYHNFQVEVASFEDWSGSDQNFDLLIAGQVFHWIEPEYGLRKSASILKSGGAIALFWNRDVSNQTAFYQATNPIYEKYKVDAPKAQQPLSPSDLYEDAFRNSSYFTDFTTRKYPWQETYDKERYFKLLDTFSPHRSLDPEIRQQFYAELADIVDAFNGLVVRFYEAELLFANRKGKK
ncbi:class I SAM-dependent methyltransferase [candidate division CSSED10-310 bacterium]|uniref:Class I SAM-dependent methyltransferase n=1 Tax=candidate division CSSED10-310 bacterium TaxID=2855610 RepID=A0ABV6YSI4_UNCC1